VKHGGQEFRLAIFADGNRPALRVSRTDAALGVGLLQRGMLLSIAAPVSEALRTRLCREFAELLGVVVDVVRCSASHGDCYCPGT
jgi:hypothetical protein